MRHACQTLLASFALLCVALKLPAEAKAPAARSNGLALTPPMGLRSWNDFGDEIDEQLVIESGAEAR